MNFPTIHPPGLKNSDNVAIVAPAGPMHSREALDGSIAVLERMGLHVSMEERLFQASRYLAGSDADRAEGLMRAFEDESIKAIVGLRGGYGCSRLIPYLDIERLRPHPKVFMGFSDLVTLHLFFHLKFGWITLHGPMALNPGIGKCSDEELSHLSSLWRDPGYKPILRFPKLEAWNGGKAEGKLAGGCLSSVTASIGTPYEIDTEETILFLEDVGEPPYRLDRMLTQLKLAGKLENAAGILLGDFIDCEPSGGDYQTADALKEILRPLGIPILANFPAGHGSENWAIPLGSRVRIDANALSVELLEPFASRQS